MTMEHIALLELLDSLKDADVDNRIRLAVQNMYQELIDAQARGVIGTGPWEGKESRTRIRNGSWVPTLSTTAGDLDLRIPKLRSGSFFPSLLEHRRRIDQALIAVNQPACH
jgi:transposase-like protein